MRWNEQPDAAVPPRWRLILGALAAAAVFCALLSLSRSAWLMAAGDRTQDTAAWWPVGRAMLNGLRPYADIYECKPPGAFVLGAASLALTGGFGLGTVLSVLLILALPALFAGWALMFARGMPRSLSVPLASAAFAWGAALAAYVHVTANGWQTEFYGGFFCVLYALAILRPVERFSARQGIAALCLLCGIGFKEPFLLTALAIALVLCGTPRAFLRGFVEPLLAALAAGTAILAVTGMLGPYLGVYIPSMLNTRLGRYSPFWVRGFDVERALDQWNHVTPFLIPLFAGTGLLACYAASGRSARHAFVGVCTGIAASAIIRSFATAAIVLALPTPLMALLVGLMGFQFGSGRWPMDGRTLRVLLVAVASYVALAAIGAGGDYQGHHFAFAFPFLAALFFAWLRSLPGARACEIWMPLAVLLPLALAANVANPVAMRRPDLQRRLTDVRLADARAEPAAAAVDSLLDACGEERYLALTTELLILSYTRHSPWNFYPFTLQEHVPRYDPVVIGKSAGNIAAAQVIILTTPAYEPAPSSDAEREFGERLRRFIHEEFTPEPWACASGVRLPAPLRALYRKERGTTGFPE